MISSPKSQHTYGSRILIPVSIYADKEKIIHALHALSAFKNPLIVLLNVIELPSKTVPLDEIIHGEKIAEGKNRLKPLANWLESQGFNVEVRVVMARDVVEGIVNEANSGGYSFVIMMKRRGAKGFRRLLKRSVSEAVIRSTNCLVITALMDIP